MKKIILLLTLITGLSFCAISSAASYNMKMSRKVNVQRNASSICDQFLG